MGRMREARGSVERIRALDASFAEQAEGIYEFWFPSDGPWPGLKKRIMAGLEKAGLFDVPEAARPVIAVLPFDNLSGDPEQEYFADGITEDIITRLAQFPELLVLARNTTFQFKGQAVDVAEIAEALGASYVVEGSIRRGGDTIRVSAQLIDADGTHLWAKNYDRALNVANIFAVQDEVTAAVASRIGDSTGIIQRRELRAAQDTAPKHRTAPPSPGPP